MTFFVSVLLAVAVLLAWAGYRQHLRSRHRRALETSSQRLLHPEHLDTIGRLAAGVAHEVKNPLAIMQMGIDYLEQKDGMDETDAGVIRDMNEAIARIDKIVKGLMDFSRHELRTLQPADLNQVIEQALARVKRERTQRAIGLSCELDSGLPAVLIDSVQMTQVFENLFMNAIQAMDAGGQLTVSTAIQTLGAVDSERVCRSSFRTGDRVLRVVIDDTGHGIPESNLERVFDPFFTTRLEGGTGLGLSVCKNLVELQHGCIDLSNKPEGGVILTILFNIEGDAR